VDITNVLFLFWILPISLAVYYLAGERVRPYVLVAINLLFYACGAFSYFWLFVISTLDTVGLGRSIAAVKGRVGKKALLFFGVTYNLCLLAFYKYAGTFLSRLGIAPDLAVSLRGIALPLGISFFTFKAISYLVDIYYQRAELATRPVQDVLYLSFFAQVISGPLTRYSEMSQSALSDSHKANWDLFSEGVYRFIIGFNKKMLLANVLTNIVNETFTADFSDFSVAYAWLGAICYSLQLFFDFSGYSDMAIGLSQMFGYRCGENFRYPYTTDSVARFWRKWHISLGAWFRDYVYIPLGGSRVSGRVYLNLLAVWLLTGVWHGASLNFIAWGLGYFILIAFERRTGLPGCLKSWVGKTVYRILVLLFINFQWVLFRSQGLKHGLRYLRRMIYCAPNPFADQRALFLLKDNLAFIVVGLILCMPVVPWIGKKLEGHKTAHAVYEAAVAVISLVLFVWAVSFVVSGMNNPFAYGNF